MSEGIAHGEQGPPTTSAENNVIGPKYPHALDTSAESPRGCKGGTEDSWASSRDMLRGAWRGRRAKAHVLILDSRGWRKLEGVLRGGGPQRGFWPEVNFIFSQSEDIHVLLVL